MSPGKTATPPPPPPPPPPAWTGYATATAAAMPAPLARERVHRRLLLRLVAGIGAMVVLVVIVAVVATPSPPKRCTPPYCGVTPPTAPAVAGDHTFTSATYGFALTWFDIDNVVGTQNVTTSGSEIDFAYPQLKGGEEQLAYFAQQAKGADAQKTVEAFVHDRFAGATLVYPVPNAMVGYQPGYGGVYDLYPQSANGQSAHERLVVISAVKKDLAITGVAVGPFYQFAPNNPTNHPSAVDLLIALIGMDNSLNSIRWPGDPLR